MPTPSHHYQNELLQRGPEALAFYNIFALALPGIISLGVSDIALQDKLQWIQLGGFFGYTMFVYEALADSGLYGNNRDLAAWGAVGAGITTTLSHYAYQALNSQPTTSTNTPLQVLSATSPLFLAQIALIISLSSSTKKSISNIEFARALLSMFAVIMIGTHSEADFSLTDTNSFVPYTTNSAAFSTLIALTVLALPTLDRMIIPNALPRESTHFIMKTLGMCFSGLLILNYLAEDSIGEATQFTKTLCAVQVCGTFASGAAQMLWPQAQESTNPTNYAGHAPQ